jgi:hypothetical protein
MLKMKNILPVFVALLFLGLANTAFAQLTCNVASTPVSRDTTTGLTEPAGDITFSCSQGGAGGSTGAPTLITVDYGTNITNDATYPATTATPPSLVSKPVNVVGVALCTTPNGAPTVNNVTEAGQVIISLTLNTTVTAPGPCTFTLTGVLLALSGSAKTSVTANVSVSPSNNVLITAGQNTPTVVTSVQDGLLAGSMKASALTYLTTNSNVTPPVAGTVPTAAKISVTENYIDMFKSQTQFNSGGSTNGVQLLYAFSGIPATGTTTSPTNVTCTAPTNLTVTATGLASSGTAAIVSPAGGVLTSTSPNLVIQITAADTTQQETLTISCAFNNGVGAVPIPAGTITATVTLAPNGTPFCTVGTNPSAVCNSGVTGNNIPRYTAATLGPVNVVNIISATTHMIFPFVNIGAGFDTGFVIANTSGDPYGTTAGGARPLGGPVTIVLYPQQSGPAATTAPSPVCIATGAGAPGTTGGAAVNGISAGCTLLSLTSNAVGGLGAGGVIPSGGTWAVLGSQLLSQIGSPTSMSGYAFGIANFPFAHPSAFVVDATFSGKFTAGGPALVLPNPAQTSRNTNFSNQQGMESLGH